jgi:hypothetical protein
MALYTYIFVYWSYKNIYLRLLHMTDLNMTALGNIQQTSKNRMQCISILFF